MSGWRNYDLQVLGFLVRISSPSQGIDPPSRDRSHLVQSRHAIHDAGITTGFQQYNPAYWYDRLNFRIDALLGAMIRSLGNSGGENS